VSTACCLRGPAGRANTATPDRVDEAFELGLPAEERLRELGLAFGGAWHAGIAVLAGDDEATPTCDLAELLPEPFVFTSLPAKFSLT